MSKLKETIDKMEYKAKSEERRKQKEFLAFYSVTVHTDEKAKREEK